MRQQSVFTAADLSEGRTTPTIKKLIITSPYEEPTAHWAYDAESETFTCIPRRRNAGYLVATPGYDGPDDPGQLNEIPRIGVIRKRVREWREQGYPGATGITKRLLEYWNDQDSRAGKAFFFCQLEAAETLIWLTEGPQTARIGIDIPGDGGEFVRQCAKMATGTGKTVVMAMIIAWQILNKVANPGDKRFSRNVLVVAPGLTVRRRLSVLQPADAGNYYDEFRVVPTDMGERLRQGRVLIRNWHSLQWDTAERIAKRRSVDKRGAKSDAAWLREVLGDMHSAMDVLVINDEAHHAWRISSEEKARGLSRADKDAATKWVAALDRLHRARGIRMCYDFTATPFVPGGKRNTKDALFDWIVSDFGLNDAIEAGLVKTPKVVVRDDAYPSATTYKSRLFHIYMDDDVKENLNRKAHESAPLPALVTNAYMLLGYDWERTAQKWKNEKQRTPPVMITVANRTETAARIKYALDHNMVRVDALCNPEATLHIDSSVLNRAESAEKELDISQKITNKKEREELIRRKVNTVGQPGQPGEHIQNVISVGMLSEGWDAKTVTHIMGLRAFSSQLLCEQVVGRGLRRTSYEVDSETGLLPAEYVNVFGIPFTFLPHEKIETKTNGPTPIQVALDSRKSRYAIRWPNVQRINYALQSRLSLDIDALEPLYLDAARTILDADVAPIIDGRPGMSLVHPLNTEHFSKLAGHCRLQYLVFQAARDICANASGNWGAAKHLLVAQIIGIVERVLASDKVIAIPDPFQTSPLKRQVTIALNMARIIEHLQGAIRAENVEKTSLEIDPAHRWGGTRYMRTWYTTRPRMMPRKNHVNYCVCDSELERREATFLDLSKHVEAWVKNDHLDFEITYRHQGIVRKYRPDFIVRLTNGVHLILETKGEEKPDDRAKWRAMREWCTAVTAGGYGRWVFEVSSEFGHAQRIVERHAQS